ncbi:MAG: FliM/FliN family flagellar motor switch protein [Deltaproteobacteria bacterium]|nr:FliM/FliN family flagellar motor switch protein [Deltaproteobacteria bacterium]
MSRTPPPPPPPSGTRAPPEGRAHLSALIEPESPRARALPIRPFRFTDLERYPRDIVQIHRALLQILPEAAFEPGFLSALRGVVRAHTQLEFDLWMHSIRALRRNQIRAVIPGTTFIAVIGLAPLSEKLLLEVDLRFVYRVIDQLLGGRGAPIDVHRPLTEIEHGIFSFVLLKVLQLFHGQFTHPEQVALRLEDTRNDIRSCAEVFRDQDHWVAVTWKMNFDLDVGYVRVLVPAALARQVTFESAPAGSAMAERVLARTRSRLPRLAGLKIEAPVEIGRIELSLPDLDALDPGDIILLEDTQVGLAEYGIQGPAKMRIGRGECASIHGEIGVEDVAGTHQMVFQITQLEIMPRPAPHERIDLGAAPATPAHALSAARGGGADSHGADEAYDGAEPGAAEGYGTEEDYDDDGYEAGEEAYDDGDEADDGRAVPEDLDDEDYGLDDEDAGPEDEEYGDYQEGYEEAYEEGYEEEGYEEGQGEGEYEEGYDPEGAGHEGGADDIPIEEDHDNLAEAHPLLGDIPVSVSVELGRVRLTADEVIRLRAGMIIELGQTPNDPVDLVVNGRLVARGELVEIQGQLGVKILHMTKDDE